MKGGKAKKVMGPLFPRLHVNDTEKGGPRAPPRNKMALYEQLSIPSQGSNSTATSGVRVKHHVRSAVVPSASSSQVGSQFSSFYIPSPAPSHSVEKVLPPPSDGENSDAMRMELERESTKSSSYRALNITGHFLSTAEGSSIRPNNSSNSKNSCGKKVGDEDDFRVLTYSRLGIAPFSNNDHQHSGGRERPTSFPMFQGRSTVPATNSPQKSSLATCKPSSQLQNTLNVPLKRTTTTGLKLRQLVRNPVEPKPSKNVETKYHMENSASHQSTAEKNGQTSKYARISMNGEHLSGSVNENDNMRLLQEAHARLLPNKDSVPVEPRCYTSNALTERGNVLRVRSESDSRAFLRTSRTSPTEARNCNEQTEGAHQSLRLGEADRNNDGSDTSMVDSISGLDISPDEVVGVMGQKHFWKARRAIVNQQRVFAVQVFELHRLMKVQKFIASSPHLLLEDYPYLGRPSMKVPTKKVSSDYIGKSQQQISKPKDDSQKPSQSTDCRTESGVMKPLLPRFDDGVRKGPGQISSFGPSPRNPSPPAFVAAENKPGAWCFHPPGNQWLVPMMSPSEGLVYKPYTGPCTPPADFMAPIHGGCGPLSLPPIPSYGVPASHQQSGVGVISGVPAVTPNYFPPYGMLVMNPIVPSSAEEQMNPSRGAPTHEQAEQISMGEINFNMHSGISCSMSNQKSEAFSSCVWKIPASRDCEVQGSTGSSPSDREQRAGRDVEGRNALPLLPMSTPVGGSDQTHHVHSSDQQTHVIKVVPYNPRSATKSAARIFQSIQEERQQYDSL